jgi:four helix bundle protein
MDLAVAAPKFAETLPATHRFELASQVRKSATSIPSNIAEGYGQRGDRVLYRHIRIALGSLAELETQIELALRLNLITQNALDVLEQHCVRSGQLLNGLRRTLRVRFVKTVLSIGLLLSGAAGVLLTITSA